MTDPSTDLSKTSACARCRRIAQDEDDLAGWELIDDDMVCPGCFTLLEVDAQQRDTR